MLPSGPIGSQRSKKTNFELCLPSFLVVGRYKKRKKRSGSTNFTHITCNKTLPSYIFVFVHHQPSTKREMSPVLILCSVIGVLLLSTLVDNPLSLALSVFLGYSYWKLKPFSSVVDHVGELQDKCNSPAAYAALSVLSWLGFIGILLLGSFLVFGMSCASSLHHLCVCVYIISL